MTNCKFAVGDIVRPSVKYKASGKAWEGVGKVECVNRSLYDGTIFIAVHFVVLNDCFLPKGAYCIDFCAVDEIELVPDDCLGDALLPEHEPNLYAGFNLWPKRGATTYD